MMIRRVIDRVRQIYEGLGATRESDPHEQFWRKDMGARDEVKGGVGELVDPNPAAGLMKLTAEDRKRVGPSRDLPEHWGGLDVWTEGDGQVYASSPGEHRGSEGGGDLLGDGKLGDEGGGELNPGMNRGVEIHGQMGDVERSHGVWGGVEFMRRLSGDEVERMWEAARGTGDQIWHQERLQSGEVIEVGETAEERDMRLLGPLTWRNVGGWMQKQVVGDGRVWKRGVGWVRLRGRRVRVVLGELRVSKGKVDGVWKGRRVD